VNKGGGPLEPLPRRKLACSLKKIRVCLVLVLVLVLFLVWFGLVMVSCRQLISKTKERHVVKRSQSVFVAFLGVLFVTSQTQPAIPP
jgi:hypothetical protein